MFSSINPNAHSDIHPQETDPQPSDNSLYAKYDQLYKDYMNAKKDVEDLKNELVRLQGHQNLLQLKNEQMKVGEDKSQNPQKGFKLLHLQLVAIVFLIIGALLKY